MKDIFFSIVVSCFNQESCILNCLKSIKNQNFNNYECIIVDDFSSDNSELLIKKFTNNFNNFFYYKMNQNSSIYMVRKFAISKITGDYVLFIDGDDYFDEDFLMVLHNVLSNEKNDIDVIEFPYYINNRKHIFYPRYKKESNRFLSVLKSDKFIPTVWNKLYKTNLVKEVFNLLQNEYINFAEDVLLTLAIAYKTKKYKIIKKPLVFYNTGTGISTTINTLEKNSKSITYIKKMLIILKEFLIINNEKNIEEYYQLVLERVLTNYIFDCRKRTKKDDIYKSIILLIKSFDDHELKKLYPKIFINDNNISNVISYYGKKRLLKNIFKIKKGE